MTVDPPGNFYLVHPTACVLLLNKAESKLSKCGSKGESRLTSLEVSAIVQGRNDQD